MTIGALADSAGVPTSTVRFYERRGLLSPDGRSDGNYRLYSEASLERLRFIVAAKEVGFALADVQTLLEFADGVQAPCNKVQALIEHRLERGRIQMERLQEIDRRLTWWLRACKRAQKTGRCDVVERLRKGQRPGSKKTRKRP